MDALADVIDSGTGGVGAPPGPEADREWQYDRRTRLLGGLLWRAGGACYLVCVALQALVIGALAGAELAGESRAGLDALQQLLVDDVMVPAILALAGGILLRALADFVRRPG